MDLWNTPSSSGSLCGGRTTPHLWSLFHATDPQGEGMGVCHTPVQSHLLILPAQHWKEKSVWKQVAGSFSIWWLSSVWWTFSTLSPVCVDIYLLQHLTAQCLKKRLCAYYYSYYYNFFFGCQLCQGAGVLVWVHDEILWTGKELGPSATAGGDGNERAAHGVAGLLLVRGALAQRPCSVFRCTCWLLHWSRVSQTDNHNTSWR